MPREQLPLKTLKQRIIALHLPHLPTDLIARQRWGRSWRLNARPEAPPIVIVDTLKNALRIVACEDHPELRGIQPGQSLSDARAINPHIECVQRDHVRQSKALERIARWCERYTPLVSMSGEDGLFLDVTGCVHLFGGEAAMIEEIKKRITAQGFHIGCAMADTPGAAWALARFGSAIISPVEAHKQALLPLPLSALRISEDDVRELNRVGFKTIGCLVDLPRAPLAARFGARILQRLDQALGHEDEVLSPLRPVAELVSEKRFAEPVVEEDEIKLVIRLLCENAIPGLERRGLGMRACELNLFRTNGEVETLCVEASSPLRDEKRMAALFDERLTSLHDEWEAGFGFDLMRLSIVRADQFIQDQHDLVATSQNDGDSSYLIDRLSARLGANQVQVFDVADTHIPERRFSFSNAIHAQAAQPALQLTSQPLARGEGQVITRPLVLFERPERVDAIAEVPEGPPIRFRWRKAHYEVVRVEGPERIACEWWKDGRMAQTRDYFRVEDKQGYRLWLFRHGLYDRETNNPHWYVHGMFG